MAVGHQEVDRHQQQRPEHHKSGAFAHAVHQQAEQRGGDHGGEGKQTVEQTGFFNGGGRCQSSVIGENFAGEEINREGAKRKNGGVEGEAECDDIPVGPVEAEDTAEIKLINLARLGQVVIFLRVSLQSPVDQGGSDREDASASRQQQRTTPTGGRLRALRIEDGVGPGGRVVSCNRGQAGDGEVDAESETELLAAEPLGQSSGDGHDHGLGTQTEDGASRDHGDRIAPECGKQRAQQTEHRKNGDRFFGADAVNDDSTDQQGEHGSYAVAGIQPGKRGGREAELIDEDSFQRIDAVVNIVVAAHGQADEDQHGPAVEARGLWSQIFQHRVLSGACRPKSSEAEEE